MPSIFLEIENYTPNKEGYIVANPIVSVTQDDLQAYYLLCSIVDAKQASTNNPVLKWIPSPSRDSRTDRPDRLGGRLNLQHQLLIRADVSNEDLEKFLKEQGLEIKFAFFAKPRVAKNLTI